jgi:flagellar hook-length control protein FliK
MVRQFLAPQTQTQSSVASAAPVAAAQAGGASAVGADAATQAAAAGSISAGSLKGLLADLSSTMDSEEDGEYTSDASYLASGLVGDQKFAGANGPSAEFQAELAKAAQEPMSVSDLVDKAQVMVVEGGGEMKVTLTNEGMGEVAMKVSVQDGKVQVQMITESDEAKKMIERQLSDLKASLQSNDLKLDTIKIDTATNLGKQFEQQYEQAQRQSTASAWEQFRQDNQGWRRSFFETPSAKLYKGQGEAPRDIQAPTANAQRKNINRRLDLVA